MRHWKPPEPNLFQTQALNILSLPLRKQALELFRILFRETMSAAASEIQNAVRQKPSGEQL
jgi:hypothetical protein